MEGNEVKCAVSGRSCCADMGASRAKGDENARYVTNLALANPKGRRAKEVKPYHKRAIKINGFCSFGLVDSLLNLPARDLIPNEINVEDKSLLGQVKLITELEPKEKNMVFKMIDTFLIKQKFKDFFAKNITAL